MLSDARLSCIKKIVSRAKWSQRQRILFALFAKAKWGNMVLQTDSRERNFRKIMEKAQFDVHYTNHSLRRSCATPLYEDGVLEQLIQETTGHRSSDGVRAYEYTSSALELEGSKRNFAGFSSKKGCS